jgi:hypothetical protein
MRKCYKTIVFWVWVIFGISLFALLFVGYVFPNSTESLQNILFFIALSAFVDGVYELIRFLIRRKK